MLVSKAKQEYFDECYIPKDEWFYGHIVPLLESAYYYNYKPQGICVLQTDEDHGGDTRVIPVIDSTIENVELKFHTLWRGKKYPYDPNIKYKHIIRNGRIEKIGT